MFSRCRAILEKVITYLVAPGMKICSDGWKGYAHLSMIGFIHGVIIHDRHYVDPIDPQINT